jgi:hypothetical protein
MRTFVRRSLLALLALPVLALAWDVATYDPKPWLADQDRLTRDMAQGYANLDWIAAHRRLDLARLDRDTRARLAGAHSRIRALLALRDFVHAFGDPHLKLQWGERPIAPEPPASAGAAAVPAATAAGTTAVAGTTNSVHDDPPAGADCAAAGYEDDDHAFRFPFERIRGWQALGGEAFPIGRIGDVGVLRIAQLGEERYAAACAEAFTPGIGRRALQLKTRARLQARLRAALASLRANGARRLLVDVSGNGGGSEWVAEVITLLTDRRLSRAEPRVVAPACDRAAVWHGRAPCAVFSGPPTRATLQGVGAWTGPVLVLADRGTASASEDLVAWLQQNKVASILGERTMGAGCGYVDGGTRTQLRASHFDVRMPNCARFLDDGTNEIEGLAPDIALPMQAEDAQAQADALARLLADR